ncbi:50S ribosomal protein L10 [Acidaminobacter hydrogenoformans]|uniref:Large ribosomal subunit protein uL10 n=1 Tax=Acidaminobacter hydrogenoformans DSM 2784 TaxID=1120920 RepID=A0A1G5S6T0_9FIRM|nr:50S ribosomal protein L10 [Acidaminobacter hydrogenoformans]SCZ82075.1 large subunit ribosomal protein L10 [Acidaminobacter hydrogenoformans DSM 2784]
MSNNFDKKKLIVQEIKEKFEQAKSVVVVDYRGLKVEEATELRKIFREAGVDYKIYKNNLVKLALEGTDFETITKDLTGPNAIAFGFGDPVVPAKILKDFAKDHKNLELKSGVIESTYYDVDGIKAIADIPSREVLIAKFLGSVKSPISNFAYLLQNIIDKQEGQTA